MIFWVCIYFCVKFEFFPRSDWQIIRIYITITIDLCCARESVLSPLTVCFLKNVFENQKKLFLNKSIEFNFICISLQLNASHVHKLTRDVLTERMKDIIEIVKLFCIQCQHAKKNAEIPISQIALHSWQCQFYIQLVFKAPLCITITISNQKSVSGSLFLIEKKIFSFFLDFFFFFSKTTF